MTRAKESLTVGAEDSLCENNTSLLIRNNCMFPVPPQGVLKGLNTSFAAAILRGPTKTNQMTTEGTEGRFRREVGSQSSGRMTRAKFASLLGIGNPPPRSVLPGPVTERTMPTPAPIPPMIVKSSVPSSPRPLWRPPSPHPRFLVRTQSKGSRSDSRPTGPGETNRKWPMNF